MKIGKPCGTRKRRLEQSRTTEEPEPEPESALVKEEIEGVLQNHPNTEEEEHVKDEEPAVNEDEIAAVEGFLEEATLPLEDDEYVEKALGLYVAEHSIMPRDRGKATVLKKAFSSTICLRNVPNTTKPGVWQSKATDSTEVALHVKGSTTQKN